MSESFIGCVQASSSENEPENWLLCNGIERDNIDNKYSHLINIGIGCLNDKNKYTPPNYNNSIMAKVDDTNNNIVNLLMMSNLNKYSNLNKCHIYLKNKKVISEYNNCYTNCNVNDFNIDVNIQKTKLYWLIRYK